MINQGDIVHHLRGPDVRAQIGYSVVTAVEFSTIRGLAIQTHGPFFNEVMSAMTVEWSLESTVATSGNESSERVVPKTGSSLQPSLINSASLLVSKIPVQGRRGWMFIPGFAEISFLSSGKLAPNVQANLQQIMNNWLGELQRRNVNMAMRRSDGTLDLVSRLIVRPTVGRQDQRLTRSRG